MTKEKREHGQSRVATYWYGLQARSLRFCIALLLVMTIHAILLIHLELTGTDDLTIYMRGVHYSSTSKLIFRK